MEDEKNNESEIDLRKLWAIFAHCWWIMLIAAVVVTAGLYIFFTATHEDEYTATAITYVMKESNSTSSSDVSISNVLVNDFVATANLESVLEKVIYEQGLIMSTTQLRKMIHVSNQESSRFVQVSVTAKDPARATDLANSLAKQMCSTLNDELMFGQKYASVADPSKVPSKPSNPVSLLKILLIAVACALLVYVVYVVMFLMDDKINTSEDVERYLELNLLGQIPNRQDVNRGKKYAPDSAGQ